MPIGNKNNSNNKKRQASDSARSRYKWRLLEQRKEGNIIACYLMLLLLVVSLVLMDSASAQWPFNDGQLSSGWLDEPASLAMNQESGFGVQPSELEQPSIMRRALAVLDDDNEDGNKNNAQELANTSGEEIFLLEDKDYPRSLFEDYSKRIGQVSGITTLPTNDVVIFHRAERQWTADTQMPRVNSSKQLARAQLSAELERLESQLIGNDTLMILERDDGNELFSFGANLFYMPHSVASDSQGNLWVSDVGRHQVMRLPTGMMQRADSTTNRLPGNLSRIWPDIVLGEPFTPGQDQAHFCQPAEIAVSSNGRLVFVADGYCNKRVMVFTGAGQFVSSFGQHQQMSLVHSLALIEERNLICVADREKARILCYCAGLDGDLARLGELQLELNYPIGRVYAIASISRDHLLVSSSQVDTNRYDLAILNPFTRQLKLVWTSSDLLEPHSLACTFDRQYAYTADVSRDAFKKVFKFNIIKRS